MKKNRKKAKKQSCQTRKDIEVGEAQINENLKNIEKEIVSKKELPEKEKLEINKKVFENILIADIVMVFLCFIILGSMNIESAIFITDLKVFSIALIILTIGLFEYSYRKENANICIHGIECFVLSVLILSCIYTYSIYFRDFSLIVSSVSFLFAVYYLIKAVILYRKMKKAYITNLNDINEIIKK